MSDVDKIDQLHCQKGIYVTCDSSMRELIKYLDANRTLGCTFVIEELDDTHLFLDAKKIPDLEKILEQRREELCPDINERD
uniref:General transcription and DNA repair factor IIH subunit TFB5 n=1 Tax=Panagrellus redivivus TaxID=6233 RepID=A0A7E4VCM3_PANRE